MKKIISVVGAIACTLVAKAKEGIPSEKIFFVGNVMIDSLVNNIQEETTYLGIQCITLRDNTGGTDLNKIDRAIRNILGGKLKKGQIPPFWDGKAAGRIWRELVNALKKNTNG